MRYLRMFTALVLAWAGSAAMALPTMNYTAAVIDRATDSQSIAGRPDLFSDGPFATPGTVSVSAGEATASIQATANPGTGVFKSLAHAAVTGGSGNLYAGAGVNYGLIDTLVFNGPAGYGAAAFSLAWDTRFSGLATQAANQGDGTPQPTQHAESVQILEVYFTVPNPNYVQLPGCPPGVYFQIGNTEMLCPQPTKGQYYWMQNNIIGYTDYDGSIAGDGNGLHNGQQTATWAVPFNVPINVIYSSWTYATCDRILDCDVTVDASHSNYLGIAAAPGTSFSSANGYQYLGRPMAPVPEPAKALLVLIGLVPLVARARRRGR